MKQSRLKKRTELMTGLMRNTIRNLNDFGYADADVDTIYTVDIYAYHFKHMLLEKLYKAVDEDLILVIVFLLTKLKNI